MEPLSIASPTMGAVGSGLSASFWVKVSMPVASVNMPSPSVIFIAPEPVTVPFTKSNVAVLRLVPNNLFGPLPNNTSEPNGKPCKPKSVGSGLKVATLVVGLSWL